MPRETSLKAFKASRPTQESVRQVIIAHLQEFGGATCDEIVVQHHLPHQSVSPCLTTFARKGITFDTGKKRPTQSGCEAIVWALKPAEPTEEVG